MYPDARIVRCGPGPVPAHSKKQRRFPPSIRERRLFMKIRSAAAAIVAIIAAITITACGAKKPKTAEPSDIAGTAQTAAEDVITSGSGGGTMPAGAEGGVQGSVTEPGSESPSMPEAGGERTSSVKDDRNVVLADNDECRVTVTGYGGDQEDGYEVKLLLENKNKSRDCLFAVERAYLDGIQSEAYYAGTAAPEKSIEGYVHFNADEMKKYGIKTPTDIALYLSAIDPDYYNGDYIDETCHVYPGGYGKASPYKYAVKDGDKVLAENENASIILTGFSKDEKLDYFCADLCLVNKTKEALVYTAEDVIVNGEDLYPYFSHTLDGGCTSFTQIVWPNEDMSDLEPSHPESIKATFFVNTDEGGEEKLKKECVLMP